jgi:outer membrane protein, heavy metal efflux system
MNRRSILSVGIAVLSALAGCAQVTQRPRTALEERDFAAQHRPPSDHHPVEPMAITSEPAEAVPELLGPQPVDVFIRRALAENRTVQAAYHNVQSLKHRIPQVTALDDPFVSNVIFPIPSVAPQYSLMGYNPYNMTLAQQFPWFGTLRLRGEAAERDVQVALAELAAAQLDTVATVKRAYFNLYASGKTDETLAENRKILEDFRDIARQRQKEGGTQEDVVRAELLISELDRERASNQQGIAAARAVLCRQLHVRADSELMTLPELSRIAVPAEIKRLNQLAVAARPELQGRLAAIARDEKAIELARKRFYPNVTVGLTYMDMSRANAVTPITASGSPNLGLFVGFNLPVHQNKYRAGVCEAQERAAADAKLYEAQRDETFSEIQDLMVQAKVQQNILTLLRDSILPRARQSLELVRSDYAKSNVNYATVLSALREILQIQLQIAQVESELGKALAALERAVGVQINEHPPSSMPAGAATAPAPRPGPSSTTSPFGPPDNEPAKGIFTLPPPP